MHVCPKMTHLARGARMLISVELSIIFQSTQPQSVFQEPVTTFLVHNCHVLNGISMYLPEVTEKGHP